jgi:hypothetical protein
MGLISCVSSSGLVTRQGGRRHKPLIRLYATKRGGGLAALRAGESATHCRSAAMVAPAALTVAVGDLES